MELGGCGLSGLLRAGRAGQQWAAVAPKVASSPRAAIRRPSCGVASSIPAAGVVVRAAGLGILDVAFFQFVLKMGWLHYEVRSGLALACC